MPRNFAGTLDSARPPARDEIEVSLFGPGYGECLLVHVGDDQWIIVDSCTGPAKKRPVALEYLEELGVDPEVAVSHLVATHWHDDHIRGLSELAEACSGAEFYCSSALFANEFLQLVCAYEDGAFMEQTGVSEIARVIDVLTHSGRSPRWAIQDRVLLSRSKALCGEKTRVRLVSLSPSDKAVTLSRLAYAGLMPKAYQPKKALAALRPNHASVVLSLELGAICMLFGADLEVTRDSGTGWSDVADNAVMKTRKSVIFKIPHHGSETAHSADVWEGLLEAHPIGLLSPFRHGRVILPKETDRVRIASLTPNAYMTSTAGSMGRMRRPRAVQRTMDETVKWIAPIQPPLGHIRLRGRTWDARSWAVELSPTAERLVCQP